MYRFNGHDSRLDRMLESTLMVMEAFEGYGDKVIKKTHLCHSHTGPGKYFLKSRNIHSIVSKNWKFSGKVLGSQVIYIK